MAIRFVDKQTTVTTNTCRNLQDAAGIQYDRDDGRLKYNDAGTIRDVGALARGPVESVITTNVIAAAESGTTFFLNLAGGFVSTLPAAAAGLNFRFIVGTAPSGGTYTVVTPGSANLLFGAVHSSTGGNASSQQAGDTITFADGAAVIGDTVEVLSDGTNWYVRAFCDADAGITITQAS